MLQFRTENVKIGEIPCKLIFPVAPDRTKTVVFYHGWSSSAALQRSRAALLAAYGYTVLLPEAVHHGTRGPLPDYFAVDAYEYFWETVFRNLEEFAQISDFLSEKGLGNPWVMGHSMGGITAMGLAYRYADKIRGAVSFNGSGDWELTHLFIQARFGVAVDNRTWPWYEKIKRKSPLAHLSELKSVPIFMTNGEADPSVDPRAQARFAAELEKIGGRGKRITYPGLAHFVTTNMIDDAISWMENSY